MTDSPTPKVSVITPSYNCVDFIRRSYLMLLNQSFKDWEWVFIDDGSQDNTWEIIREISASDNRVKPIKLEKNMGRGFARNFAVKKASSNIIVIWDVDDLYCANRLNEIYYSIGEKKYDFFYSDALVVDMGFNIVGATNSTSLFKKSTPVFRHPSLAFNKHALTGIGYNADMRAGEDLEVMLFLQIKCKGYHSRNYHLLYVQDREVNVRKTYTMNLAHIQSIYNLTKIGIIKKYDGVIKIIKLLMRQAVFTTLILFPNIYLLSVKWRKSDSPSLLRIDSEVLNVVNLVNHDVKP
jgi:glycosyltransferase involved in cell wall biosynthesis